MYNSRTIGWFTPLATLFSCASLLLVGWFPTAITGIIIKGFESDRQALLAIKSQIHHDRLGITSSWNNSIALCQWKGITCGRRHQRITKLDLSHQRLGGTLSPHVGNLSFLRVINLEKQQLLWCHNPWNWSTFKAWKFNFKWQFLWRNNTSQFDLLF